MMQCTGTWVAAVLLGLMVVRAAAAGAPMSIVAHRGASHDAPENTLAAFKLAWQKGADAIEGDFRLTKDRRIVCMHDATTKRTAGRNLVIANSTLAELRQLDVGRWRGEKFAGQRIATLEEVLAVVPKGKRILIEIKSGPEIVPVLKTVLEASVLKPEQTTIIAFDAKVVAQARKLMPKRKAFWLTGFRKSKTTGLYSPSLEKVLATLAQTQATGLDCSATSAVVDAPFIAALRAKNLELHVWTVDDLKTALHFRDLGADSITTNRPRWLREQMAKQSVKDKTPPKADRGS